MLLLLFGVLSAKAQEVEGIKPPSDKKKIELRPNSRDYGAVQRDNSNQRIERKHDKNMFVKKRPVIKRKLIKPGVNKELNREKRIQRRQKTIQRRRLLQ